MAAKQPVKSAQQKEDALELARLLYDIYKKQKQDGKIISGQNNAQRTKT